MFAIVSAVVFCHALSQPDSLDLRVFVARTSFSGVMSVIFAVLTVQAWLRAIEWLDWPAFIVSVKKNCPLRAMNCGALLTGFVGHIKKIQLPKFKWFSNLRRHLIRVAVISGIAGLACAAIVAALAINCIGPDWFDVLDVTIASVSGILFGGGLGAWFNAMPISRRRLYIALVFVVIGVVYVAIGMIFSLRDVETVWLDVYYASGGAMAGAALSVVLDYFRN